jgi:hypothetical protein
MAAIVVTQVVNNYLPLAKSNPQRISLALWPNGGNAGDGAKAQNALLGQPDFVVYGTTDTNTTGTALDLTAQGVTFPDATMRTIRVEASIADNDGMGLLAYIFHVDGGSTPIGTTTDADGALVLEDGGLNGAPTMALDVSTANVILVALGISGVPCRWVIKVWVDDLVPLAYHS